MIFILFLFVAIKHLLQQSAAKQNVKYYKIYPVTLASFSPK